MRYVWPVLLLCSLVGLAQSRPARHQNRIQLPPGYEDATPAPPISPVGRYQIFFNPNVRADTFLVDTEDGRIWRMTTVTDVVGEPTVWLPERRLDNDQEVSGWMSLQRFKPTGTTSTTPQQ